MKNLKRIIVIGGGITGLSTMYFLQKMKQKHHLDLDLVLIEQSEQLGGKIRTVKHGEYTMEAGADSMVATKENVLPFLEELGLKEKVVYNATGKSYIYSECGLLPIPEDTVFGIPTHESAIFTSQLLSEKGKLRVLEDYTSRNETFTKESSIGEFLEYFLGKEIVEKQISPILSGVYSGNLYDLSISSTLPYLLDYKNEYGSILKGLEIHQNRFKSKNNKKFISFKDGLGTLIDTLENNLTDVKILKGVAITAIQKEGQEYVIDLECGGRLVMDHVVLSTSHQAAQQLLDNPQLDVHFNQLLNTSLISVYLGYDILDRELPKDGTGFIVAKKGDLVCNACTWTSRKWPNTSTEGNLLVRLFYKSSIPNYEELDKMSEKELLCVAMTDIEKSLGITVHPKAVDITKWNQLMPNYTLQHPEAVSCLQEEVNKRYPGLLLAGCSYFGVGIGACITNGKDTAEKLIRQLLPSYS